MRAACVHGRRFSPTVSQPSRDGCTCPPIRPPSCTIPRWMHPPTQPPTQRAPATPTRSRHATALVCRRWRQAVLADALHTFRLSSTSVVPGWFEGKGHLLQRWGSAVQCLSVDDGGPLAGGGDDGAWPLSRYVALLQPGALRALSWSAEAALPPDVAARLPALTSLTSLTLLNRGGPPLQLAPGTLGALARLAQLRCLVCFCSEWSQPFLDTVAQVGGRWGAGAACQPCRCTPTLLRGRQWTPHAAPQVPARRPAALLPTPQLTALTRLHLQEGWAAAQPASQPCALASFARLTQLRALRELELCTSGRPPAAGTLRLPPLAGLQHLRLVSVNANSMQARARGRARGCASWRAAGLAGRGVSASRPHPAAHSPCSTHPPTYPPPGGRRRAVRQSALPAGPAGPAIPALPARAGPAAGRAAAARSAAGGPGPAHCPAGRRLRLARLRAAPGGPAQPGGPPARRLLRRRAGGGAGAGARAAPPGAVRLPRGAALRARLHRADRPGAVRVHPARRGPAPGAIPAGALCACVRGAPPRCCWCWRGC